MGLRGPQPQGNNVRVSITVTPEISQALNQLVALSGISKKTFVRQALLDMLSTLGLVYPEVADSLKPTLTAGPTRTDATQKRK